MMKQLAYLIVVFVLMGITACKSSQKATESVNSGSFDNQHFSEVDMRLHDIWVLDIINGQKTNLQSYSKGLPQLEIFVEEQRIGGHDGCNRIMGSIATKGDSIQFGALATTMMACQQMKASDDFRQLLDQNDFHFLIKSNKLILNAADGSRLIFKKID